MEQVIIRVFESSNEQGYVIDIFETEQAMVDDEDPIDGGFCTGSFEAAVQMGADMANTLIERDREANAKTV